MTPFYHLISVILPFECLQQEFMQQALIGLMLLAPMASAMGVQVVNFRMAFFSDAISHSAFAGVALGLIFDADPHRTMPLFGLLVGLGIMAVQRHSTLSSDTVIGVFFSGVVAFGLAVVSRDRSVARDVQRFLYGDILTIGQAEMPFLAVVLMMVLAILLNLCSEADAFIAASFRGFMPLSAQMAFMLIGPMFDLKLLLMYQSVFQRRAIIVLASLILVAVLGISVGIEWINGVVS